MSAPARAGRSPACCIRPSCCCSCWWPRRSPRYIPLAALAGVLAVVAWNMAEMHEFLTLLRASRGDAVVLLATFLLTIFRDLTEGIVVGFVLGAALFIHRMAGAAGIAVVADRPDSEDKRGPYDPAVATTGASWSIGSAARSSSARPRRSAPCSIASSSGHKAFVHRLRRRALHRFDGRQRHGGHRPARANNGVRLHIVGATPAVRSVLTAAGVGPTSRPMTPRSRRRCGSSRDSPKRRRRRRGSVLCERSQQQPGPFPALWRAVRTRGLMPSPVSKDWMFVGGLMVVVVAFCAVACDLI